MRPFFLCGTLAACIFLPGGFPSAAAADSPDLVRLLNDRFTAVYEKAAPSVVVLEVGKLPQPVGGVSILPNGWQSFFNSPRSGLPPGLIEESPDQGSGIIFRPDGHIVTNFHVIANADPNAIRVTLKDGRDFPARLVGADEKTDLAVLKIDATDLPAAELADSDQVKVGQFAFALGAPNELPYTFTFGLVSAIGRNNLTSSNPYEEYIQTDASINPGNSGGPLCDIDGRVIGINTLISGINRGLGFAIPSNLVKKITDQLADTGRVIRPWLGITIEGLTESPVLQKLFPGVSNGVVVHEIHPSTPASRSALQPGDIILEVNQAEVRRALDIQKIVLSRPVGDVISLKVWREGHLQELRIPTAEQPDSLASRFRRQSPPVSSPISPSIVPQSPRPLPAGELTAPDLGFEVQPLDSPMRKTLGITTGGVIITAVLPDSPAAVAGLQPGDVITHLGKTPVESPEMLRESLKQIEPRRGAFLLLIREGSKAFALLKP